MDLLTNNGVSYLDVGYWTELCKLSVSEFQWLAATMFAAIGSTIAYNIIKFNRLGNSAPDTWSWATLPIWFLLWLHKVLLIVGCILILWYIYRLPQNTV